MNEQHDRQASFSYTYSAKEQNEIRRIREKYAPKKVDGLAELQRLDRGVTRVANAVAIMLGVVGCLLMGVGMCCAMVWLGAWFLPGIGVGVLGIALVALAYPVHTRMVRRARQRIAPEILRLSDELLQ